MPKCLRQVFPKSISRHGTDLAKPMYSPTSKSLKYILAYPMRIFGLVSVDRYDSVAVVENLKHYSVEVFKGLQVLSWLRNLPPTDAYYCPLYVKCVELNVSFAHRSHTGPLYPSDVGRPIPYIDKIALKFHAQSHCRSSGMPTDR